MVQIRPNSELNNYKPKMSTTRKTKKPRAAARKPKYADMIAAAIKEMKERGGTSRQKIVKYIGAHYKVGNAFGVQVRLAIRRMLKAGALLQAKGTGASGSFKLPARATKRPVKAKRRRSLKKRGVRKTKRRSSGSRKKPRRSGSRKKKAGGAAGRKRRSTSKRPAKKPRTQSKRKASKRTSRGRR